MAFIPVALAVLAGAQALYGLGKGAGWWGRPPKRPGAPQEKRITSPFESQYLKTLQARSSQGIFSPGVRQRIVGETTMRLGEVGARQKGEVFGDVARQGLERSIVGRYATRGIDRDVLERVARVSRELATENELSKVGAQDVLGQYGRGRTAEDTRRQYLNALARFENRLAGQREQYGAQQEGVQQFFGGAQSALGALGSLSTPYSNLSDGTIFQDETGQYFQVYGGQAYPTQGP